MASCLLHNLDDFDKADMQSAGVLLGLMPLALSFLSPTIGELTLVSYRRPVLTCLMVIGAPAMSVTRLFKFTSIGDTLNEAKDTWPFSVRKRSPFKATIIVVIQYIWVALAVNNSLWNSVQLGKSTILSWKCLYPYMQLSWHFIPLAPFACATIALWRSKGFENGESKTKSSNFLSRWLHSEFKLSANHTKLVYRKNDAKPFDAEPFDVIGLNGLAVTCIYVHWVFGTLLFSSVLFIGTLDALGVIARYLASALFCRVILLVELSGIKGAEEPETATELSVRARRNDPKGSTVPSTSI